MKREEYIPTALRPSEDQPREERWGIGCYDGSGGVGMKYGPYPTELETLEEVGEKGDLIFHFLPNSGVAKVVWRWRNDRWRKVK